MQSKSVTTNKKMLAKTIVVAVAAISLLLVFTGCSSNNNEAKTAEDASKNIITVGEKTDNSIEVKVNNETGKEITSLSIINPTGQVVLEQTSLAIPSETTFAAYINPDAVEEVQSDFVLRDTYDILATFADGTVATVHGISNEGTNEYTLLISDDGIMYVEYTTTSGTTENTLEGEKALIAANEAAALAAAEAEAAAAQAATSYDYAYSYDYSYSSGNSSSVSQSEDQCVDGGVALR